MSVATQARFSETMLALGVVEERVHGFAEEAIALDGAISRGIEPTGEPEPFWGAVEAIVAAEPIGTLGQRLARFRDAGELTTLDRPTTARARVLLARLQAAVEALGKVEDDFAAVLHYCGSQEASDVS